MILVWAYIPALAEAPPTHTAPAPGESPQPAAVASTADWPMWGGRPDRNMVSNQRNLPAEWSVNEKRNLKWVAPVGSQTFGNPVVAGGKVFIGTNNGKRRNPAIKGDKGVLMCFAEADGRFLWQAVHDKLEPPDELDWPEIGICSTPCVLGNRAYYVSNRGELTCLDTEGFLDGTNDGPVRNEKAHGPADADFVWTLDMVRELGVSPHQASTSSPLVWGDLVFVVTGNGTDIAAEKVPTPQAPSFIAVNRTTGRLVWGDSSPGDRILAGQWSAPACSLVNGRPQVVFPGGDGWIYAFEPATGRPLWKFNCNSHLPADVAADRGSLGHAVATPVFVDNKVFIAVGHAPESGNDGPGCLWAIDATKSGDVTAAPVWRYTADEFAHSISTVAIHNGLLYVAELRGFLRCVDVSNGTPLWMHDLGSSTWASPMVADGKVYIGTEDGDLFVFAEGREDKLLAKNQMKQTICSTVTPANCTLYIVDRSHLYAIAAGAAPPATQPATVPVTQAVLSRRLPHMAHSPAPKRRLAVFAYPPLGSGG